MDSETETKKTETISINCKEHKVADLNSEQVVLVNHVADLDNKARSINFNLEQTLGARNHFMSLLESSFEKKPKESKDKK